MDDGNRHWLIDEFRHVDFGDLRLLDRFFSTALALSSRPLDGILQACGSMGAAKGAYRMFGNEKFSERELISSHQLETAERMRTHAIVFALQDTTFLDFDSHSKTKGLGSVGKGYGIKDKLGLLLHPSLVVTETGLPLGCLALNCWARPVRAQRRSQKEKSAEKYRQSIEEKESNKWLKAWHNSVDEAPKSCRVITVGDREADIYELMAKIDRTSHGFVIRSRLNRRLTNQRNYWRRKKKVLPPKLWDVLATQDAQGVTKIDLPAKGDTKARKATVEIRYRSEKVFMSEGLYYGVEKKRQEKMPRELLLYAVNVKEQISAADIVDKPLDWTLLTSEPVNSLEDALKIVDWYKLRWTIECFFRILKSGCRIEACRLAASDRLKKYIILMSIIAYSILFMEKTLREAPQSSADVILTKTEWQALACRMKKSANPPVSPPTAKEAILWIAKLGGFSGRKSDGYPGHMVLWRGWQRLSDTVETWISVRANAPP